MPQSLRLVPLMILWISTLGISLALEPSEAEAQAAMKRSAGSLNRASGDRRGNSLGSQTRGHDSGMSSESSSSSPVFRSPDDDSEPDDESDSDTDDEEEETDTEAQGGSSSDKDSEDEPGAAHAHRTLGRACMYGARGGVIFRPAGSRCRGDDPEPDAKPRVEPPRTAPTPTRSGPPNLRPAFPAKRATSPDPSDGRPRGSCIYGVRGEVIHAPAGVDCRR
jgi:hypothetical protein